MSIEYAEAFVEPATKIWERELRSTLELKHSDSDSHNITTEDISAHVAFRGDVEGHVLFGFSRSTARNIVYNMLGRDILGLDELARSALRELASMISLHAATVFSEVECSCVFEPPGLIEPLGARLGNMHNPHPRVTFGSELGNLHIHIGLSDQKEDDSVNWLWQRWR